MLSCKVLRIANHFSLQRYINLLIYANISLKKRGFLQKIPPIPHSPPLLFLPPPSSSSLPSIPLIINIPSYKELTIS